jgi:dihydroorotate dehydrogenase (NAD+) catalytic subunit
MAWQASRAVAIPVIGVGGIASARDALEFLIAGCRAVQVGTANFVNVGIYDQMLADLADYLERHGRKDINEVVATLSYPDSGPAPPRSE